MKSFRSRDGFSSIPSRSPRQVTHKIKRGRAFTRKPSNRARFLSQ